MTSTDSSLDLPAGKRKAPLVYLVVSNQIGFAHDVLPLDVPEDQIREILLNNQVYLLPAGQAYRLRGQKVSLVYPIPEVGYMWSSEGSLSVKRCLRPGEPGTLRERKKYGDRLVCVRYRQFATDRCKTVELVENIFEISSDNKRSEP